MAHFLNLVGIHTVFRMFSNQLKIFFSTKETVDQVISNNKIFKSGNFIIELSNLVNLPKEL